MTYFSSSWPPRLVADGVREDMGKSVVAGLPRKAKHRNCAGLALEDVAFVSETFKIFANWIFISNEKISMFRCFFCLLCYGERFLFSKSIFDKILSCIDSITVE